jgi:hypothetical protein
MKEGLELQDVALLGRTFAEYSEFFSLRDINLSGEKVLDIGAGVSSFCAEASEKGYDVTGADPIYAAAAPALALKCKEDLDEVIAQVPAVRHKFNWAYYRDVEHLRSYRESAYRTFLSDYEGNPGRYVNAALPETPFRDDEFSIALASHFLFLYEGRFVYEFHRRSIRELARIAAKEVRIYPLTNLEGRRSAFVDELMVDEKCANLSFEVRRTNFEFLKNADELLLIRKTRPNSGRAARTVRLR